MAGFHLTRAEPGADARLAAARARFAAHGFTAFTAIRTADHVGFHVGYIHGGPPTFHADGDDFIAVAGTLVFDGAIGQAALAGLLAAWTVPFTAWNRVGGQFALVVHKAACTTVATDYFGAFQLFHDEDYRTVTTSFLAAAEAQPRLGWHDQGVYEFAFNVFPIGDDTVFAEVRRLGPDAQLELGTKGVRHPVDKPLPAAPDALPLDERVRAAADTLSATARPFVEAWGNAMQAPLSGGLDSRLALGMLRAHGVRPHVYVYGEEGDDDVEIARAVGRAEGFEVELFNKPAHARIDPEDYPAIVGRNFDETDALVTDGGLFDNGGNAFARHARQAGGQLAVSGGCGEVFRNFFYLSNQRFTPRDVALAFFARFKRSDTSPRFRPAAFLEAVAAKLGQALGRPPDRPLARTEVEQLYPRARCRAFFGREISLVGRHGGYFMPFLDHHVVAGALRIPMDLKRAGRFEAMLLHHIDPALARQPSAYGHDFAGPPSRDHRLSEWSTVIRPPWVRQQSYALRRRLGPIGDEHGGLFTPAFLGRVLDLHFPHMRSFFRVPAIEDRGLYRRVATLEYLGQHVAGRLIESGRVAAE